MQALLCYGHYLSGLHIPHKLSSHSSDGCTFGSHKISLPQLPDTQWLQPPGIPDSYQLLRAHNQESISALDCLCHLTYRIFNARAVHSLLCNRIGQYLRIRSTVKHCPLRLQSFPQYLCIGDIPIVGKGKRSLGIVVKKRLGVLHAAGSCGGISHMTDSDISPKSAQNICMKYFADQTHPLMCTYVSDGSLRIAYHNACRLLTAMLQCNQSIINPLRRIDILHAPHTEHATFFLWFIHPIIHNGYRSFPLFIENPSALISEHNPVQRTSVVAQGKKRHFGNLPKRLCFSYSVFFYLLIVNIHPEPEHLSILTI